MRNDKGSIEILLLLCCLVGVVAFFTITLAFANVLNDQTNNTGNAKEWSDLLKKKAGKETLLRELEEKMRELEQQRKALGLPPPATDQISEPQLEDELRRLQAEYDSLSQRIKPLRQESDSLMTLPDPESRLQKEKELASLQKRLEELVQEIEEKQRLLGRSENISPSDSLKKIWDELRGRKTELEAKVDSLEMVALLAGKEKVNNPLYVDCQKSYYVCYPGGRVIAHKELENRNVFREMAGGYGMIIFFVRPDGFESFKEAWKKVESMTIEKSYEPLEADRKIDFLSGVTK